MRLLRYVLKRLIVVAAGVYLAVFIAVVYYQRSFIFLPSPLGKTTPAEYEVPYENVSIPVQGGGTVDAWWNHYPAEPSRPTIFYCHGNGASLSSYGKVSQIFYRQGWNALLFDYRGYGSSSPATEGLSEESTARDAEAAYSWLLSKVPESNIVVWGHSLGSSIAARLASSKSPAGLVLEGGFTSLYDMARERYPYLPIFPFMLLDRFATAEYVTRRTFPALIVHAEHDRVIPLRYGRQLYERIDPPKQWLLLKGVGHNDFPSVHEQYDADIAARISEWLKARASAVSLPGGERR